MRTFKITIIIISALITFCGCKKKKPNDPPADTVSMGTFMLHLHSNIDQHEVERYDTAYTTGSGRKILLNMAQMYISGIQLVKLDGTTVDFTGVKLLKTLDSEVYYVGTAPVGNYKSIRFKVGLDQTANQENPTTPSDSALLNKPQMWFGASAQPDGYVFLNVQGKIDTTANASGTEAQMQSFVYKIGTNANYKQIIMPDKNFSIAENQTEYGHITIDYSKIFNGTKLYQPANLSVATTSANSTAPATVIVNNLSSMFIYEQ
jgi:hypothetical protein